MWQHFLAWLRGDLNAIVSEFDKLYAKLDAHAAYKSAQADAATKAAVAAADAANAHTADAAKAVTIRDNIGALIGK